MADQRLQKRYARRFAPQTGSLDRLAGAIQTLMQAGGSGDPFFLSRSLELLAEHLHASQTTLVMMAGGVAETRWWHPELPNEEAPPAVASFCQWLLDHPDRTLVVRDMTAGPHLPGLAGLELPYQAALGCALRQADGVKALVFAFFDQPQHFSRAQFALVEAVSGFMSRVMEIEDLKQSLHRLEDALAITQAVMEDSSTRDPDTDLPNLRYLEIWEKAMLASEHRPASLVVAECNVAAKGRKEAGRIKLAAEGVRAGDLVVRGPGGRLLVIFRHTPRSIAHVLLLRMRTQLGSIPMGVTLWVPGPEAQGLESCRPRLSSALEESRAMAQPGLVWHLPEGVPPEPMLPHPEPRPVPPVLVEPPPRWQPLTLRKV